MQKLLTLREVSDRLGGRSRASLYIDWKLGRLPPPIKIGGRTYMREGDLANFIAQQPEANLAA
ncbi:MAG: helix-turn-helix transcriptional regulator [Hyphomonadaceae bacterium]